MSLRVQIKIVIARVSRSRERSVAGSDVAISKNGDMLVFQKKWGHARFSARKKVRVPLFFLQTEQEFLTNNRRQNDINNH